MPTPAVTLKLRRFRRRFGIAAPRVTVRTHVRWQWYLLAGILLAVAVGALSWSIAQRGETAQLREEVRQLQGQLDESTQELQGLRTSVGTEQSGVQIERSAKQQLLSRVRQLESENAGLKEDIAFFEHLVPADGVESAVRIERLRVSEEPEPHHYRFRLLVGFVATKQVRDFKGRLQLVVAYTQGGREQTAVVPGGRENAAEYAVEVRHFLRKEGVFSLPPTAKLKSIEARLFQGDTLKAKRSAQL